MSDLFNFGIGIQIDKDGTAEARLGAIVEGVTALGAQIRDVNSAVGFDQVAGGIAAASSDLDNTLTSIHDHAVTLESVFKNSAEALREALNQAGIGSDAIVGAVISESPAAAQSAAVALSQDIDAGEIQKATGLEFELLDDQATSDAIGKVLKDTNKLGDSASEDFEKITGSAKELDKELKEKPKDTEKVASAFSKLKGVGVDAFSSLTEITSSLGTSLVNLGDLMIGLATNPAMELERTAVRLTASIGGTSKEALAFTGTIDKLAQQTGFAETEIGALAEQLAFAGFNLGEFTDADQTALVHLTSNLQVSTQEARAFVVSAELMGASITELMVSAAEFQEQFKIPGLIEQMPAITENAIKVQSAYGKSIVKDSKKASKGVAKSAAIIAKALGKTATEAAQDAMETFNAFAGETRSFNDVFLGLADSFSPMQTAFLETGMSVGRMGDLMRRSQTDQAGFVKQVLRTQARLDPFMAERFMQQILRSSSAAVQGLLTQAVARKKMTQAERDADDKARAIADRRESATKALDQLLGNMRNNVLDTFGEFSAKLDNLFGMVTRLFGPGITAGFNVLIDALSKIVQPFMDIKKGVEGATDESEEFKSAVAGITKFAVGAATVIGSLATTFFALLPAITPVWDAFIGIIGSISGVSEGATGLASAGKIGAKVFTRIIAPIGLVIASIEHVKVAFKEIKGILESDGKLGFKKFKKILGSVFVAAIRTIDDFFFGLPSKFIEGITGGADAVSHEGARKMGTAFGKLLGGVITTIKEFFRDEINPFFKNIDWKSVFGEGDVIGGFTSMWDEVKTFAGSAMDGILAAFDLPPSAAGDIWDIFIAESKLKMTKLAVTAVSVFTSIAAQLTLLAGLVAVKIAVSVGNVFDSIIVSFANTIRENQTLITALLSAMGPAGMAAAWKLDTALDELESEGGQDRRRKSRADWEKTQTDIIMGARETLHEDLMTNMDTLNAQMEEDAKAELAHRHLILDLKNEEFELENKRIAAVKAAREEENKILKASGKSPIDHPEIKRHVSTDKEFEEMALAKESVMTSQVAEADMVMALQKLQTKDLSDVQRLIDSYNSSQLGELKKLFLAQADELRRAGKFGEAKVTREKAQKLLLVISAGKSTAKWAELMMQEASIAVASGPAHGE